MRCLSPLPTSLNDRVPPTPLHHDRVDRRTALPRGRGNAAALLSQYDQQRDAEEVGENDNLGYLPALSIPPSSRHRCAVSVVSDGEVTPPLEAEVLASSTGSHSWIVQNLPPELQLAATYQPSPPRAKRPRSGPGTDSSDSLPCACSPPKRSKHSAHSTTTTTPTSTWSLDHLLQRSPEDPRRPVRPRLPSIADVLSSEDRRRVGSLIPPVTSTGRRR